jgi:hypothetical protein
VFGAVLILAALTWTAGRLIAGPTGPGEPDSESPPAGQ